MKQNERELWYNLRKAIIDNNTVEIMSICNNEEDLTDFVIDNEDICMNLVDKGGELILYYERSIYMLLKYAKIKHEVTRQLTITLYNNMKAIKKSTKGFYYIMNMIKSISMNKNITVDPLLKTMILLVMKKKKINYKKILDNFTERGIVNDEFVNKFEKDIDFNLLALNDKVSLDIISKYEPRIKNWGYIALRNDLTLDFVVGLHYRLPVDIVMYNKILIKDLEFINKLIVSKCLTTVHDALWTIYWKCCDNIITNENGNIVDILEELSVLNAIDDGIHSWDDIHKYIVLSDSFILKYSNMLNISNILKYYPLSPITRVSLEKSQS